MNIFTSSLLLPWIKNNCRALHSLPRAHTQGSTTSCSALGTKHDPEITELMEVGKSCQHSIYMWRVLFCPQAAGAAWSESIFGPESAFQSPRAKPLVGSSALSLVCGSFPPSHLGPGHCYFRNMRVMDEWLGEETLLSPAMEIGAWDRWESGWGTSFLRHHQLSMQDVQ